MEPMCKHRWGGYSATWILRTSMKSKGTAMSDAIKTLNKMKKANKLVQLTFREFGPRSYKRGMGSLLSELSREDGATQRDLVVKTGMSRGALKNVVLKAKRKGYVTIEDADAERTYTVKLTEEGAKVAAKRNAKYEKVAEEVLSCLTAEEVAQLDAITEKLVVACKDKGVSAKKKGFKHFA